MLSGLLAAACGAIPSPGGEEAVPTDIPVVVSDIEIEAEGRIVPNESVQLSFFTNGQVEEILVEEGDLVKAGDVLARLGNREELEAGIANAEAELLASQQALDSLYDDVDVAKADTLKAVAAANRAVRDAQYRLDNFTVPTNQADLETMEAVTVMKERLDEAREIFEPYKYKSSSNATRKELKDDLEEAQSDYNTAIRRLEYETAVEEAQSKLDKAVEDLQMLQEGPDPDHVEAAGARIKAAEAALKSTNAAFDHLDLVATIDGTILDQDLIVGQDVIAGQPVMMITDFSQMYAETDDLTEIEVVDISVGQEVIIVPDALPDVELVGTVEEISKQFEEKRGDITYTTRILIEEFDPRLRWGMTVLITFKE
jgi:multidrug efflux pump subunit AcrA (membrane-fusion protein)